MNLLYTDIYLKAPEKIWTIQFEPTNENLIKLSKVFKQMNEIIWYL